MKHSVPNETLTSTPNFSTQIKVDSLLAGAYNSSINLSFYSKKQNTKTDSNLSDRHMQSYQVNSIHIFTLQGSTFQLQHTYRTQSFTMTKYKYDVTQIHVIYTCLLTTFLKKSPGNNWAMTQDTRE